MSDEHFDDLGFLDVLIADELFTLPKRVERRRRKQERKRLTALEMVRRARRTLAPAGVEMWVSREDVQRFAEQIGISRGLASQAFNALVHCGSQDSINLKIRGFSFNREIELYDSAAYVQLSGTEKLVNFGDACAELIVRMRDAQETQ